MAKEKRQGVSFEELQRSLRRKEFSPLYLFFGEEDFLIKEALELVVQETLGESTRSFNLDVAYGADVDSKDIIALASSFPMMNERRVVIVKEFDKVSDKDSLLPYIEHASSSTSLCLVVHKPDFRVKFFKTLEKTGVLVHCKQLYDSEVSQWIQRLCEKHGKAIEPEASQLIQAHVGNSLNEISNEIDKLVIYIAGKKTISIQDVNSVVGMSKEYNIFELQKAVGKQSVKRSVEILDRMLNVGESPLGIIVMLTRYFQKVWLTQELIATSTPKPSIASRLGVNNFYVEEYTNAARAYDQPTIHRCFAALLEADETLKSTSADPKLVMVVMLYRILRQGISYAAA